MVLCQNIWFNIIALLALLVIGFVTYCKWVYKFWKCLGVPYLKPTIPFGNAKEVFFLKLSHSELAAKHYKKAKAMGYKHVGLFGFTRPEYMPIDLEIIKNILVKNFNYFCDRGFYVNEEDDPLSGNLFMLSGSKWKNIRAKLSPTFTSGKMKMMFSIVIECSQKLNEVMNVQHKQGPINIKNFLERFGTDVIGSCAFGLSCNSFDEPNSDFCKFSKRSFNPTKLESLKDLGLVYFPAINKFFNVKVFPKDVSDFFLSTVRNVVEYRKTNNLVRNDFLQILIDLMQSSHGLSIEEVAAQAFVFFVAGFETSSTVMMFCLLELSLNREIQKKLREEINSVIGRFGLTYESLNHMVYMRQVLDEVMRKYPPIAVLNRICTKDYKIPKTKLVLKKGTPVAISVLGIQNDPEYFPEPEKFDPERFAAENKEKLNQFCYMPFGEGPHMCIGLRFGFLQMKVALSILLKNYRFSLNEKTKLPLKMNAKSFILSPERSIWLNVEKI
ncbi:hypothetical protein RN001_011125 [Aquatica leii]|uniref:Cytochrome P450 n=1 Tax=Aquatica leii TaxID=1421715 RepID=A0AAN7P7M7_9COLE|nr:hypothetical protein RN001_011125 [Aquatica leii]